MELGAGIHFSEHVEIVVARAPVRSQGNGYAQIEKPRYRGDSRSELHIAFRVMNHFHVVFREQPQVVFVEGHAVVGDQVRTEKPKVCQVRDRTPAVFFQDLFCFGLIFRKMDDKGNLIPDCRFMALLQKFGEQV